jgi:hypothetical protein
MTANKTPKIAVPYQSQLCKTLYDSFNLNQLFNDSKTS